MRNMIVMAAAALAFFVCGATPAAETARDPTIEKDIVFGKAAGEEMKLDLVRGPAEQAPAPLIIWLHGGGWRHGDRKDYHEGMVGFGKQGWAGATVQYRFAPKHKFPAQIDDVRMALAFLRANAKEYNIDPDRIAVVGASAGGHLALLLGSAPGKDGKLAPGVRAVVSYGGPTDFRTWRLDEGGEKVLRTVVPGGWEEMVKDLLGTTDRKAAILAEASPITHVRKGNPAVLSLQGSADNLCPVQQANDFHAALKKAGVTEKLVVFEGEGHGLTGKHATKAILEMIAFLNQHVKEAKPPVEDVELLSDVEYGKAGGVSLKMHVLRPKTLPKQPMPVLVWIHGGGWEDATPKENGLPHLVRFAQRGYLCATIDYRLSGKAIFPAQIEDCKCAIRFLRSKAKEWNLDPDRIGVWGESAGGHLAALLGTSGHVKELEGSGGHAACSSRVQAVCDWYGPSDLPAVFEGDSRPVVGPAVEHLLGGSVSKKKELAILASPVTHVTGDAPPFLILHGDKDELVKIRQSELLHEALKKAKVDVTFRVVKGGGHGFNGAYPGIKWPDEPPEVARMVDEFFDLHLTLKR